MAEQEKPDQAGSDFTSLMNRLIAAAPSFKRMSRANEEPSSDGIRTIWHRGQEKAELLTWEKGEQQITRQELTFQGRVIELTAPDQIKTGVLTLEQESTQRGQGIGEGIHLDDSESAKTLDLASTFLRHVSDRDYYVQFLLRVLNDHIANMGIDTERTKAVTDHFSRDKPQPSQPQPKTQPPTSQGGLPKVVWLVLAAVAIGFGVFWGLWF